MIANSQKPDRNLAMELVRVTESAALAAICKMQPAKKTPVTSASGRVAPRDDSRPAAAAAADTK